MTIFRPFNGINIKNQYKNWPYKKNLQKENFRGINTAEYGQN